jgi:hypothetical protein
VLIRAHIGCANDSFVIDHVPGRHRQSVFGFVVKPVQGATEGLVKIAQVMRQHKDKAGTALPSSDEDPSVCRRSGSASCAHFGYTVPVQG